METFLHVIGPFCGEFTGHRLIPHKDQWRGALMFCLICVRINGWVNNWEAGDLRCHRAHYGITVMVNKHSNSWKGCLYIESAWDSYTLRHVYIARVWHSRKDVVTLDNPTLINTRRLDVEDNLLKTRDDTLKISVGRMNQVILIHMSYFARDCLYNI